jgi:hypothetical protein
MAYTLSFTDEEIITLLSDLRTSMIRNFGEARVLTVWNPNASIGMTFESHAEKTLALYRRIEAERNKTNIDANRRKADGIIEEGSRVRYLGTRFTLNRLDIYTIERIKAWGGTDNLYATVVGGLPYEEYPLSDFVLI